MFEALVSVLDLDFSTVLAVGCVVWMFYYVLASTVFTLHLLLLYLYNSVPVNLEDKFYIWLFNIDNPQFLLHFLISFRCSIFATSSQHFSSSNN